MNLQAAKYRRDLTYPEIASRCTPYRPHLNTASVHRMCTGATRVCVDDLVVICQALGVSAAEVLTQSLETFERSL